MREIESEVLAVAFITELEVNNTYILALHNPQESLLSALTMIF